MGSRNDATGDQYGIEWNRTWATHTIYSLDWGGMVVCLMVCSSSCIYRVITSPSQIYVPSGPYYIMKGSLRIKFAKLVHIIRIKLLTPNGNRIGVKLLLLKWNHSNKTIYVVLHQTRLSHSNCTIYIHIYIKHGF